MQEDPITRLSAELDQLSRRIDALERKYPKVPAPSVEQRSAPQRTIGISWPHSCFAARLPLACWWNANSERQETAASPTATPDQRPFRACLALPEPASL